MTSRIYLLLTFLSLPFLPKAQTACSIPAVLFPEDTIVVCSGSSYTLSVPFITGASYNWSTIEAGNSISIAVSNRYWVEVSDGSCTQRDTVIVLFNSFLLAPQTSDLLLCKNRMAAPLTAPGQNLLWYSGPLGGTGNPVAPVPSTADTGRLTHWVSQTIFGCESPRSPLQVIVIDTPYIELGNPFIIPCEASGIVLQVVPDGYSTYAWSNGSNHHSILADRRGQYSLYAYNQCGSRRDTVQAVECNDKCVQTPTGFTPNADGKNDLFRAACFCPVPSYYLVLYNRNGEKVFETRQPGAGWDGYFRGRLQPNGVYVFYTEYFDFVLKQSFKEKGTFVLMR